MFDFFVMYFQITSEAETFVSKKERNRKKIYVSYTHFRLTVHCKSCTCLCMNLSNSGFGRLCFFAFRRNSKFKKQDDQCYNYGSYTTHMLHLNLDEKR